MIQGDGSLAGDDVVNILGDYFTDSFALGGAQLKSFQMGLANSSVNDTLYYNILGLGRSSKEAPNASGNITTYPNFLDQLLAQSLISTRTYSLYLNDLNSTTGSMVFGGIDTKKFSGTLGTQPYTNDLVDMAELTFVDNAGVTLSLTSSTNLTGAYYISDIVTNVPGSVIDILLSRFGSLASDDRNNSGVVFVDCGLRSTYAGAYFTFTFGSSIPGGLGPAIKVPIGEMVLPYSSFYQPSPYYILPQPPFADTCVLGMTGVGDDDTFLLGNTFLRSAYVVIDLDSDQTALAQSVYGATESNIVEVTTAMNGIPTLSGVAASSTSTSPNGSNPGTGAAGGKSTSTHISGGAIAGIIIGVLAILAAVIGVVVLIFFQRRRAARQTLVPPQDPPTEIKTHEVPGKAHEVEKKEYQLVQGGVIDLTKNELPKTDTREVYESDRATEENGKSAHHYTDGQPQLDIATEPAVSPLELESQAQNTRGELTGSDEYPVEAPPTAHSPAYTGATDLPPEIQGQPQNNTLEILGSSQHPVEAPSATYSPAHDGGDSYGALSPNQFEVVGVPELAAEPTKRASLPPPQSSISPVSRSSISESMLPGSSHLDAGDAGSSDARSVSSGPSKLDILQERIERVRAEKERLSKLQELEGMEAALQQEIMAELKKEHGLDRQ